MSSRALRLRPVHSEKNEQTWSNLAQNAGTQQNIDLAKAVKDPTADREVAIGATIRAIYFEFHFSAETLTNPKVIHWAVNKVPAGISVGIDPTLYDQTAKRFIFKRGMEMLPKASATVFKRIFVVRIPPRHSRMGDGDLLRFSYKCSSTETINACGIAIFKSFE